MPICNACKEAADYNEQELHTKCEGGTQCFCQHRNRLVLGIEDAKEIEKTGQTA